LNNNKNVTIIASVLTLGVSGAVCNFGVVSIGTTALAMIVGIVLNLILKEKKEIKLPPLNEEKHDWSTCYGGNDC
jgi:xanthine/uracil permease